VADALLEGRGLTRRFGGLVAVDAVDLVVKEGTVHGLIGPNGAGKTTLLNLVAAFFPASAGTLRFRGEDITRHGPAQRARQGIRRTFQNLKLFAEMTALQNASVGLHASNAAGVFDAIVGTRRHRREERAIANASHAALEFVGLGQYSDVVAGALAYGHRRLLEIARAIVARPTLLLLDEPAAGLNPTETKELKHHLEEVSKSGVTVLVIEHDMTFVGEYCDAVVVLNFGRKIAAGTPEAVRRLPEVREAYLGTEATVDG
jgi:branched-chain amino acid transport system ATP-binding protein